MLKIAVTGHRALTNDEEVRQEIARSLHYFRQLDGEIQAITALAEGVDTIFAQEALKAGIALKFVLPFPVEEYQKDFSPSGVILLKKLLSDSGERYEVLFPQSPETPEQRSEAYLTTGKKIVDEADIVLAVWDGQSAKGKGGTGDIVEYARISNKELHIIQGIRKETSDPNPALKLFNDLDTKAIYYKNRIFQPVWITGIVSGMLAVACFASILVFLKDTAASPSLHLLKFILAVLEVVFVIVSFVLLGFFANKWKQRFLKCRRDAEYLRSLIWFKEARIPVPLFLRAEAQGNYTVSEEILATENEIAESVKTIEDYPNARRLTWCLAEEQKQYHRHARNHVFENNEKLIHHWLKAIKVVFFSAVGLKFVIELMEFLHVHWTWINMHGLLDACVFLVIFLPSVYAALEGIKYFGEWKRNIKISTQILSALERCQADIIKCEDEAALLFQANALRHVLELENSDWAVRYDEKEIEPKV